MSVPAAAKAAFNADIQTESAAFLTYFDALVDPRQPGKVIYPLNEVLLLSLLATLAGAETFVDIALFGVKKRELLRRFLPFAKGTPSHDQFHDVDWLHKRHAWPGLKSLVMVESVRGIGERIERESRYYLSSLWRVLR